MSKGYQKYVISTDTQRMPFGQYKGRTIAEIIHTDTDYFEWVLNLSNVAVTKKIRDSFVTYKFLSQ